MRSFADSSDRSSDEYDANLLEKLHLVYVPISSVCWISEIAHEPLNGWKFDTLSLHFSKMSLKEEALCGIKQATLTLFEHGSVAKLLSYHRHSKKCKDRV